VRLLLPAAAAALWISAACGPVRAPGLPGAEPDSVRVAGLELLGEFAVPRQTGTQALVEARFGGVSGLAVDPSSGELLGICDDSTDSRVFVFRLQPPGPGAPFRVNLHAYFPLPPATGIPPVLDPEGIAISLDGRLFVASEGIGHVEPRTPPGILVYTRAYQFVGALEVPEKFHPTPVGPEVRGVRDNAAFESLTLTPDERRLYTATETALVQDSPPAAITHPTLARILEYQREGATFVPAREFAYALEPLADPGFTPRFAVTGLVELLALGESEFLSMERGFAEEGGDSDRRLNTIRIFRASLAGATDVSDIEALGGRPEIVTVRKTLVLDLGTLTGLSQELSGLDNFEGMAFGPALPDGSRTLLVVSDDNFSERQRTWFLLFRIREG
jgi:Esterase-like activity of phytase